MRQSHIAIIGAPMDLGAGRRGVDMGPSALRLANLNEKLATLGGADFLSEEDRSELAREDDLTTGRLAHLRALLERTYEEMVRLSFVILPKAYLLTFNSFSCE